MDLLGWRRHPAAQIKEEKKDPSKTHAPSKLHFEKHLSNATGCSHGLAKVPEVSQGSKVMMYLTYLTA